MKRAPWYRRKWNRLKWKYGELTVWLNNFYIKPCRPPPLRLRESDISENPDAMNIKLWLDGVRQNGALAYDVEEGWIRRYVMEAGQPKINRVRDTFATEVVRGRVRVAWVDNSKVWPWEVIYGKVQHQDFLTVNSRD